MPYTWAHKRVNMRFAFFFHFRTFFCIFAFFFALHIWGPWYFPHHRPIRHVMHPQMVIVAQEWHVFMAMNINCSGHTLDALDFHVPDPNSVGIFSKGPSQYAQKWRIGHFLLIFRKWAKWFRSTRMKINSLFLEPAKGEGSVYTPQHLGGGGEFAGGCAIFCNSSCLSPFSLDIFLLDKPKCSVFHIFRCYVFYVRRH